MIHTMMRASLEEADHVAHEAARRGLTVASYMRLRLGLPRQKQGQRNDLAGPPKPLRSRQAVAR